MKRPFHPLFALTALTLCHVGFAHAWEIRGRVTCQETGAPLANLTVKVLRAEPGEPLQVSGLTDATGHYLIPLLDSDQCYRAVLALGSGQTVVSPASGDFPFCVAGEAYAIVQDWVVTCPSHQEPPPPTEGRCWLTAGGARFAPAGERGPQHNWGGNVNPGCSTEAGEGGQWNHVAHHLGLHFQGQAIEVVRCGNVEGIAPGSDSPVTPVNFIEFRGTGRLTGTKGKADYGRVHFWARCEDRGEPGSHGQRESAQKDRYFLHVFADAANPNGTTLLLVDMDGNPATVDPVTITGGNMQMHDSGCDASPAAGKSAGGAAVSTSVEGSTGLAGGLWLSRTPNPATASALVRFGLPQATNVTLAIYDVSGRRVRGLVNGTLASGNHSAAWNLRDDAGRPVARGMYFLRLATAESVQRKSMLVMQ